MKTVEEAQKDLEAFFDSIEDPEVKDRLLRRQWALQERLGLCKTQEQRCYVIQQMMLDQFGKLDEALAPFRTDE